MAPSEQILNQHQVRVFLWERSEATGEETCVAELTILDLAYPYCESIMLYAADDANPCRLFTVDRENPMRYLRVVPAGPPERISILETYRK